MKISLLALLLVMIMVAGTIAQTPVPAKAQDHKIVLTGAIAHLGNGQVIQNAVIGFDMGKLTMVTDASTHPDLTGYEEIKVTGRHIYPGFILPNTSLGLEEVAAVRAMSDDAEHGEINPNVRALPAYNTDSEYGPTMRFNGILLAEATPSGGLISGTSSLLELDGWNWEDAVHTADLSIHLRWPVKMRMEFDNVTSTFSEVESKDYEKKLNELDLFFADARAFGSLPSKIRNLKLEAMQGLFDGTKVLSLHANTAKEIIEGVRFAQKAGVKKIVLLTGAGALYAVDFLRENNIPVILTSVHSLPARTDDDIDLPYKLPFLLSSSGIQVSLSHTGMLALARNLAFFAGTAVSYGMNKEDALKTITYNTAKALGVDQRVGSLEVGKEATLFVSEGDALDMRSNILTHAFIRGKSVTLPGNQQELYQRYSKKFGHNK